MTRSERSQEKGRPRCPGFSDETGSIGNASGELPDEPRITFRGRTVMVRDEETAAGRVIEELGRVGPWTLMSVLGDGAGMTAVFEELGRMEGRIAFVSEEGTRLELGKSLEPTEAGGRAWYRGHEKEDVLPGRRDVADVRYDGAILILTDASAAHFDRLRQRGIPFLVVDHRGELGPDTPSVGAMNYAGGRMAAEYLLSRSPTYRHDRRSTGSGLRRERLSGYRDALEAAGVSLDPDLCREGDFEYASGYRETCVLLDLPAPPTAIFAANDVMAAAALKALHQRGVAVPAEMSVVGFDDVEIAAWINPALTTVRQPLAEMGAFAATMLLELIEGETLASNRIELATELIARESCAAPRGGY